MAPEIIQPATIPTPKLADSTKPRVIGVIAVIVSLIGMHCVLFTSFINRLKL